MIPAKTKVLALLSGGLDSTLAVKIMLEQGVAVEAAHFTTPFCLCDKCAVGYIGEKFAITVHHILLGQEFLDILANPPHGFGSQMNPCIDCRILMLKKAKELAEKIGATCIVTGEVLDERPFSQRKNAMLSIERETGLEGAILRPLSAKLLPETAIEKSGAVDRAKLLSIQGRRRLPQMNLAKEYGIKDYPCPSGGCLLTDPQFAHRLHDFLKYTGKLELRDVILLKIGRHFRVDGLKVVVGRNEAENKMLQSIAIREKKPCLEVVDYAGPVTLVDGDNDCSIEKAAQITVRYSDAPKNSEVNVRCTGDMPRSLLVRAANNHEVEQLRI